MRPICPACDSEIEIDDMDVDAGELIGCPECGVDLRVLSLGPIELEVVVEGVGGAEWDVY